MCLLDPLRETSAWLFPVCSIQTHILTVGVPLLFQEIIWGRTFCLYDPIWFMENNDHWNIPTWMGVLIFSRLTLYCLSCLAHDYFSLFRHESRSRRVLNCREQKCGLSCGSFETSLRLEKRHFSLLMVLGGMKELRE